MISLIKVTLLAISSLYFLIFTLAVSSISLFLMYDFLGVFYVKFDPFLEKSDVG